MTTLPCSPSNLLSYGPVRHSHMLRPACEDVVKHNRRLSRAIRLPTAVFITSTVTDCHPNNTYPRRRPGRARSLTRSEPWFMFALPVVHCLFRCCLRCLYALFLPSCAKLLFFYYVLHHLGLLLNYFLAYKCLLSHDINHTLLISLF